METIELSSRDKVRLIVVSLLVMILAQVVTNLSQLASAWQTRHSAMDNFERRISLDLGFIDVGNQKLNTPVNRSSVDRYIKRMNASLSTLGYPLRVRAIQGVSRDDIDSIFSEISIITLQTSEQSVIVSVAATPYSDKIYFSAFSFLISLLFAPFYSIFMRDKQHKRLVIEKKKEVEAPRLIINLEDKTLSCNMNDHVVMLQNKPLCFYTALLKYCIVERNASLPLHKDVPPDLVTLANKTFSRLIELGHTKRKRPDFNANLDKTLSEIRAALDEVFSGIDSHKEPYYPPRAQGEGSRSKLHSYALQNMVAERIEIIGS